MATKEKTLYTQEGYDELEKELKYLRVTRREEIKEAIAVARGFGDLSENSEYDEASMDAGVVSLGSTVKVYDVEWDEELTYEIVGSNEADALNHRISDQSPIGSAMMGKHAGDSVEVQAPNGTLHFKVLHVERTK